MTQQQNSKKLAKNRDYSFVANNHANRKKVKATNINAQEEILFRSMSAAGKQLRINAGTIKMVCEGINHYKTGISKIDGQPYKFDYVLM